jgi:hypothetical protein
MKTFLKILAWFGLGLMLISTVLQFAWSWDMAFPNHDSRGNGIDLSPFYFFIAAFAFILMLLGGLVARPRYFWLASIVIGFLSFISPWGQWSEIDRFLYPWKDYGGFFLVLSFILPGLLAIGEGILIRILENKRRLQ